MSEEIRYDYVIVGSGAGGGPLAANLASAGFKVLLLEAGGDEDNLTYAVPAFQGLATEDQDYRWDYYVRHYSNQEQQERDVKFVPSEDGILYPRAGTLGGCTAHNALIIIYPSNSDWDRIAEITGDDSWNAESMRTYFQKVERNQYLDPARIQAGRHGDSGWLATEKADTTDLPQDWQLQRTLQHSLATAGQEFSLGPIKPDLDPNAWDVAEERREGFHTIPLSTNNHARTGPREYVRQIAKQFPENLVIKTGAFVTRVLFDDDMTATGVEYIEGAHLYRADPNSDLECEVTAPQPRQCVHVRREVVLAGGAFNTPQLLMLSGVGPREQLEALDIPPRVDLPGVGQNLQDRYEVGVIWEMESDFTSNPCSYSDDPDVNPCLEQWLEKRTGVYTSNGSPIAFIKRSPEAELDPDLYVFALPGHFQGYFPQWFSTFENVKNQFTWAILKAHTHNTAGTVELRSADPLDTPRINFHYFGEGTNKDGSDLDAVASAVEFARAMMKDSPYVKKELIPGEDVRTPAEIKQFIRDQAWGHHASCSCKIGADDDPMAVLDSDFRVRGTKNLRVVDASVFPHIPGMFIVLPIYMISEKASEVMIRDAQGQVPADFSNYRGDRVRG